MRNGKDVVESGMCPLAEWNSKQRIRAECGH